MKGDDCLSEYILEMKDISKTFPGVKALDHVQLQVKPGEVHALMGENGAGKSTLMKILAGVYPPTQGTITLRGETITINNPQHSRQLGIAIIFQELSLSNNMTVAENIYANNEPRRFGIINDKKNARRLPEPSRGTGHPTRPSGNGRQYVDGT